MSPVEDKETTMRLTAWCYQEYARVWLAGSKQGEPHTVHSVTGMPSTLGVGGGTLKQWDTRLEQLYSAWDRHVQAAARFHLVFLVHISPRAVWYFALLCTVLGNPPGFNNNRPLLGWGWLHTHTQTRTHARTHSHLHTNTHMEHTSST